MTDRASAAATRLQVVVLNESFPGKDDLAKGAGGDFRYIFAWANPDAKRKVTEVMLFRTAGEITNPPPGWDFVTGDINDRRGGSYLYLIGKTAYE